MAIPAVGIPLSGERLRVTYRLTGDQPLAWEKAQDICLEQTVELPADLVPEGDIRDQVVGRIESFESLGNQRFQAVISFAVETSGAELPQLLNLLFGNISLKPGIRLERLELPELLLQAFPGPRFGRDGWRRLLSVPRRPLLCTALKPMGLPPPELANLAYQFALGGIDIIKDDHGLADQPFAPFRERVERCAAAVARANQATGYSCLYMANVTGRGEQVADKVLFAKQVGAGALLLAPGLLGFDTLRQLAADDRLALPLMSHPAFQGSFTLSPDSGLSPYVLFGQLPRLAGADATIYPNVGGRFSFSGGECAAIVAGTAVPMGNLKAIFPTPGGGMNLTQVPDMLALYGHEVIFLIGADLHRQGPDLVENCRHFRRLVEIR
jgi:ribulose-bisphosphate carboxylase large chain